MAHFYWFHKYTELIPLFVKFVFGCAGENDGKRLLTKLLFDLTILFYLLIINYLYNNGV